MHLWVSFLQIINMASTSNRTVVLSHVGNTSLNVSVAESQKAYEVWAPTYNAVSIHIYVRV